MARPRSNVCPPSNERARSITLAPASVPFQNTYTMPVLSVRTVQPWRPPERPAPPDAPTLDASLIWCVVHVSPPSVERENTTGSGAPPRPLLRKATLQTYTFPKNGLDAASSAQIASLSENSADACLVAITGRFHAALFPAAAAAKSSVRDTPMAPPPLKNSSLFWSGKGVVMLA